MISKSESFNLFANIIVRSYKNIWLFNKMLRILNNLNRIPCTFLFLIIIFIEDENIIRKICNYFNTFITVNRNDMQTLSIFYKDKRIIQHLLFKMKHVQENTCLEILGLAKKLLLVQVRIYFLYFIFC